MKLMKRLMYIPLLMTIFSSGWASLGGMSAKPNMQVTQLTSKKTFDSSQLASADVQDSNTQYVPVYIVKSVMGHEYITTK